MNITPEQYIEKLKTELFNMYNSKLLLELNLEILLNSYNELKKELEEKKVLELKSESNESNMINVQ